MAGCLPVHLSIIPSSSAFITSSSSTFMKALKSNMDKRKNKVGNIIIMVRPGHVFLPLSPPYHPLNNKNPDPTPHSGEAMCSARASPPPFSWSASAACGSLNHNTASPSGEKSWLWKKMCVQKMKCCGHLILEMAEHNWEKMAMHALNAILTSSFFACWA